ncbi:GNAT family N-acetyltransferase [Streptomyces uncialis]|nr:GNAT family N-acetyltransferase [Streptomyces uncialis]
MGPRVGTAIGGELLRRGFGLTGLHRIHATCDPRNVASARVLSKLGMTHVGRLRHTARLRDGWGDSDVFSILDQECRGPALVPTPERRSPWPGSRSMCPTTST